MGVPNKMLIVKDLTFILPEDFDGNLSDALLEYVNYRNKHIKKTKALDEKNKFNSTEVVLMNNEDVKSCILYGIVEIIDDKYRIIESSSSDIDKKIILD